MRLRPALLALLSPVPALLLGAWVMAHHGASPSRWGLQFASALPAIAIALFLAFRATARAAPFFALAAIPVAATLLFDGQEGVQRWLVAGPIRLHAAYLFLPFVLFAAALLRPGVATLLVVGTSLALAFQPDAAQATAFAAAVVALDEQARWRAIRTAIVLLLVGTAWIRPDPLGPVPDVEGILGLAWSTHPLLAIASGVSLLLPAASQLLVAARGDSAHPRLSVAYASYFVVSALMPFVGHFPVPVLGFGVGPVLGTWCALGLSLAFMRSAAKID